MGYVEPFYPKIIVLIVLAPKGIVVFSFLLEPIMIIEGSVSCPTTTTTKPFSPKQVGVGQR
jgi:hypothetical protein